MNQMKIYKLAAICITSLFFTACDQELKQNAKLSVGVITNENVRYDGETITVKKGTPVEFSLKGDPDFVTFFSGEIGSKYEFRDRTLVDAKDLTKSLLNFSIWPQYGNAECTAGVLSLFISESFPGISKKDFREDSILVENFQWKELVPQSELPQKPLTATTAMPYSINLKEYLGKKISIAIRYKATNNSSTQPRMNFTNVKVQNEMSDGQTTNLFADAFGFTALNMDNKKNYPDQKSMLKDREYGTVNNNTSGIWNLKDAGNGLFFIHSSGVKTGLKYSWLISNPIVINACTPDHGVNIKNTTQTLESHTYQYDKVGTYVATFVGTNANYEHQSTTLVTLKVNVIE